MHQPSGCAIDNRAQVDNLPQARRAEVGRMLRNERERGFALLLVFAMAASIAIMLYIQLPRAAFEAQRQREEMLIDRGQQYTRAIQLYVAKNRRYPASLDELEKSAGSRYLRRRYKDPMTGEDEWRIINVDATGRLTNSLVQKPEGQKEQQYQNTFISEGPAIGSTTAPTGAGGANIAFRRRPSDNMPMGPGEAQMGGGALMPGAPGQTQPGVDPDTPAPPVQMGPDGQPLPQPGQPMQGQIPLQAHPFPGAPNQPQYPGQPGTGQPYPGAQTGQQMPGQPYPGQAQPYPGQAQQFPGQPQPLPGQAQPYPGQPQPYPGQPQPYPGQAQQPYPGQNVQPFPGQAGQPQPYPGQPGIQGQPVFPGQPGIQGQPVYPGQPGAQPAFPGQPPQGANLPGQTYPMNPVQQQGRPGWIAGSGAMPDNPGLRAVMNQIYGPKPQGAPQTTTPTATAPGGQQIGGGIAGVASKLEADSIKIVNERQKYNEWEFIYDFSKDKKRGGAIGQQTPGQQAPGQQRPGQQTPGQQTLGQQTPGQLPGNRQGQPGTPFLGQPPQPFPVKP